MTTFRDSCRHSCPTTSVVIPVFNERAALPELISRCLAACNKLGPFEIVLVDDGSRDGSRELIEQQSEVHFGQIVGVVLNRNYGQHAAVMAGLAAAKGDLIVTLDADLQNPPEEIPRIVDKLHQGHDVVGSIREERRDRAFRRLASRVFNRVTVLLTGVHMTDYGCMLRGYSRGIVNAMLQSSEHGAFIPVLANSFASNATEIPVAHCARVNGESKYGLWGLCSLQLDLLTTMTKLPLRVLGGLGLAMALFGFGLGGVLIGLQLLQGSSWTVDRPFSLLAVLFVIFGGQFVGMGLLGEYLGRVHDEVRGRPRYFVEYVTGHSDLTDALPRRGLASTRQPSSLTAGNFVRLAASPKDRASGAES